MKISEVIEKLQAIMQESGDLDVVVGDIGMLTKKLRFDVNEHYLDRKDGGYGPTKSVWIY